MSAIEGKLVRTRLGTEGRIYAVGVAEYDVNGKGLHKVVGFVGLIRTGDKLTTEPLEGAEFIDENHPARTRPEPTTPTSRGEVAR